MATTPAAMPHANNDPDHIAARASKQTFTEEANKVRSEYASELYVAEKVVKLDETHVKEVSDAYDRIRARRRARLEHLEGLVPLGRGIPAYTSATDRPYLMQAFRAAYGKAKDAASKRRAE